MFWYIATPYTAFPGTKQGAFGVAVDALATLLDHGVPVFSPIVHTHPVEAEGGLNKPHDFWMNVDRPFMEAAYGLIVVCASGWDKSTGIAIEIETFIAAGKPVYYWRKDDGQALDYAELRRVAAGSVKEAA